MAFTYRDGDGSDADPASRVATGLRIFVRLAHEQPYLGKFIVRFGLTSESLRGILVDLPMRDIEDGIAAGRYGIGGAGIASLVVCMVVSSLWMVLEGHRG
ncbi:hypothetical protein [Nocardia sp. NPDC052112]|uniref:hypothetical protein n=1 Tax=Nocardia sp. NPDC052112 TaxID=3155646 RepID=UPI0034474F14